jgi:ubiquinol-cytochrome c reductase cytochrome b subunit
MLEKVGVPFWPDAAWKDVVFAVGVGAIVLALAIWPGPPDLGALADPTNVQADPRPDWYFLWYFALLALMPAGLEDYLIVGFPLLLGLTLVMLPFVAPYGERSPRRRPWAVGIVVLTVVGIASLIHLGNEAPWSPTFASEPLPASATAGLDATALHGADLFQQLDCVACHSIGGVGGHRGPDLTEVGNRLTPDQLTWRILTGGRNMPAYGQNLKPDDVTALVSFLSQQRGAR